MAKQQELTDNRIVERVEDGKPLSSGDVARILRCSKMSVGHWIDEGKLRGYRTPGGHYRIVPADLKAFAEATNMGIVIVVVPVHPNRMYSKPLTTR